VEVAEDLPFRMSRRGLSISGMRELRRFQKEKERERERGGGEKGETKKRKAAKNRRVLRRSVLYEVIVKDCEGARCMMIVSVLEKRNTIIKGKEMYLRCPHLRYFSLNISHGNRDLYKFMQQRRANM